MKKKNASAISEPGPKRVMIVDDHPITREGMVKLIGGEPDLIICAEASNSESALDAATQTKPDIVVTDLTLPNKDGLELIKDLKVMNPDLPVLVVSMHDESIYAERVLRAGGRGYLMKQESGDKILHAIRTVLAGKVFVTDKMSSHILEMFSGAKPHHEKSGISKLSDREFEVFQLMGRGLNTKEIAGKLHLSPKTVETHRGNIKQKLNYVSSNDLTIFAVRWVESERP